MHADPFQRPDATDYGDIFADGMVVTLAATGLNGWSVGAVARWMKVSPPAVLKRFSRARLLELTVTAYGRRWTEWSGRSDWHPDPGMRLPAALPRTPAEQHGLRVWALLGELARGELLAGREGAMARYAAAAEAERTQIVARLAAILGRPPTLAEAVETTALVSGLRHELLDEHLTFEDAEAALRAQLARLTA